MAGTAGALHAQHVLRRLPVVLFERVASLVQQLGSDWRSGLLVLSLVGWRAKPPFERLLACSALSLLGGYLLFAHGAQWTVYYLEAFPVIPLLGLSQAQDGGVKGTAIAFVRYPAAHNPDFSLVSAPVAGDADPVWMVRDLWRRNLTLCAVAPGRTTYRLDVADRSLSTIDCGNRRADSPEPRTSESTISAGAYECRSA